MKSQLQGRSEISIDAPPAVVWEILEDSEANLARVLPMVKTCEIESGGRERVGAVRTCNVDFGGRSGQTIERCIESVPNRRLAHLIEADSFGFSRRLADFWFSFELDGQGTDRTEVSIETHYEPKGMAGRLMSVLMAKRKFRTVRESALRNLKRIAESTPATSPAVSER